MGIDFFSIQVSIALKWNDIVDVKFILVQVMARLLRASHFLH